MIEKQKPTFKNYFTTTVECNVKSITQAAQGYGFKMLEIDNQQDINIVQPQQASNTLKEMIDNILEIVPNSELKKHLNNFHAEFVQSIVDTHQRVIFQTRNDKTHVLSIIKIEFWKKPEQCLLTYKVTNFEYKCAPRILKLSNQSQKSKSATVLCFSSSSYSYSKSQRFVEMDRGTDEEDIRLLLQLSSMGSGKIDSRIEQFALLQ